MKRPFRLRPSTLSHDTVEAHARIHEQAQNGQVIGTTVVVMYEDGFFTTACTGECQRSPVWTIGALDILQARVRQMAQQAE